MAETVFFSWQSDRPSKITRAVIKNAIEAAINDLNAELEEADRPSDERLVIDHDTKGLPGSPDIAAAILEKIEGAAVFIADVTPIGLSDAIEGRRQKHLSNPNVLIELGYAKRALTTDRIVQVWNTAFTGCGPEDLPFDMRGKRGPISFELKPDANGDERKRVTTQLTKDIKSAFGPILSLRRPKSVDAEHWAPCQTGDASIWPTENGKIVVNEPDHGSGTKQIFPPPRSFVRILPAVWSGSDGLDRHDTLIDGQGLTWGATRGGVVTYPGSILFPDTAKVDAITKRFAKTGEVWATRTGLVSKWNGFLAIRGDLVPHGWAQYLGYAVPHIAKGGGKVPFGIQLGIVGLENVHWPSETAFGAAPHAALENDLILSYELKEIDAEKLWEIVKDAWIKYRRVFSVPDPNLASMQQTKFLLRNSFEAA